MVLHLAVFLLLAGLSSGSNYNMRVPDCRGVGAQQSVDLDQVLGIWYAIEVVHHYEGAKSHHSIGNAVVDTCPAIHLLRVDTHRIRLLWTEDAGIVEYNFSISSTNSPGFWMTLGAQNGSLLQYKRYRQFAGTVEVTKAVNTHLVLTFCTPGQEQYSVVLAREKWLNAGELEGVNRMLENRQLPRLSVKQACRNAADLTTASLLSQLAALLLYLYRYKAV